MVSIVNSDIIPSIDYNQIAFIITNPPTSLRFKSIQYGFNIIMISCFS